MNKANGFEWGSALKPIPGETESGDQFLIETSKTGILVAVIDGLGHGNKAAVASKKGVMALQGQGDRSAERLMQQLDKALRGTRGAVASLATLDKNRQKMTWVGVGNVGGVLIRKDSSREVLLQRGGVIGYRMPPLRPITHSVKPGDLLIFASDGLKSNFTQDIDFENNTQTIAEAIFDKYRRGTDDAAVVVTRYLG